MKTTTEVDPFSYYIKEYGRYIIPTWLFPIYFIAWGIICEKLRLQFSTTLPLFFVTVGIPFFGTFLWANGLRRYVSFWRFWLLMMLIPVVIFTTFGLLLAVL
jgi:hypothetical protein